MMKILVGILVVILGASFAHAKCGMRPAGSRVINGQNAAPHAWPWQISLRRNGGHTCGGSLISPNWVVTAAHCIHRNQNPSIYTVVAGAHKKFGGTTSVQQTLRVSRVIEHPNYDDQRIKNDIALLKLSSPVQMSDKVGAACLTETRPPPGKKCYITGWGAIRGGGQSPDILQQAVLPIVSQDDCKKKYYGVNSISHICAGEGRAGASGGCNGDSGGPLVCEDRGKWYLHGAVSFGKLNCPTEYYTVFARVGSFVKWIQSTTGVGPDGGGVIPPPPTGFPSPPPPTQGPPPPPTGFPSPPPPTQGPPPPPDCRDISTRCQQHKHKCKTNDYVRRKCKKTCGLCCKDISTRCQQHKHKCKTNDYVRRNCQKTCGLC